MFGVSAKTIAVTAVISLVAFAIAKRVPAIAKYL